MFDDTIRDLDARFGLGAKAAPLLEEIVHMITSAPGGVSGFIQKMEAAGLGSEVTSWLGRGDGAPLDPTQVNRIIDRSTSSEVEQRLGIPPGLVAIVMGYILPKLIGPLASASIASAPGQAGPSIAGGATPQVAPVKMTVIPDRRVGTRWWPWAFLVGLGALGVLWYLLSHRRMENVVPAPAPPSVTATPAAPPAPRVADRPPAPQSSALPAELSIINDNGNIIYWGSVKDDATRQSVLAALSSTFGADKIRGEIAVDPTDAPASWLDRLGAALPAFMIPGSRAHFLGNTVAVDGAISGADHDRITGLLNSIFGTTLTVTGLSSQTGGFPDKASSNHTEPAEEAKLSDALSALNSQFNAPALLGILNQSVIHFSTDSAVIPQSDLGLLKQAAPLINRLPAGTVLEIAGHTDNTGSMSTNVLLSQQRAEAVRSVLVQDGTDALRLVAKGYGSAAPAAQNDTASGRLSNRRITYSVLEH